MSTGIKNLFIRYWKETIFVLGIIAVIIYSIFSQDYKTYNLKNNPKFTIGIISSDWHSKTTSKPPGKDYSFILKGKKFEHTTPVSKSVYQLGDRFLVMYDSLKPEKAAILIDYYEIPANISVPKNGWRLDEIPLKVDSQKIMNSLSVNFEKLWN